LDLSAITPAQAALVGCAVTLFIASVTTLVNFFTTRSATNARHAHELSLARLKQTMDEDVSRRCRREDSYVSYLTAADHLTACIAEVQFFDKRLADLTVDDTQKQRDSEKRHEAAASFVAAYSALVLQLQRIRITAPAHVWSAVYKHWLLLSDMQNHPDNQTASLISTARIDLLACIRADLGVAEPGEEAALRSIADAEVAS